MIANIEELAQTLFEEAGDALFLFDPEDGRLVEINPMAQRFCGMSRPALLKEWLDLVLEFGWAYGSGGGQLRGKINFSAITTGGGDHAYTRAGLNHFTMRELLAPFEQTALLCGMTWLPPFVVHGTVRLTDVAEIERHAADYARLLTALRDGKFPVSAAAALPRLNPPAV